MTQCQPNGQNSRSSDVAVLPVAVRLKRAELAVECAGMDGMGVAINDIWNDSFRSVISPVGKFPMSFVASNEDAYRPTASVFIPFERWMFVFAYHAL